MYVKYHILHMDWARTLIPLDNWCCWNTRGAGPCWLRSQVQEVQKLQAGVQADQKLPISGGKKQAPKKKKCVSAPARTLLHSMRSIWRTIVFLSLIMKYPFPTLKPMLVSPGRARAEDRAAHLRQLLLQHPSTPISCTSIQKQHCHHSFSRCIHE